MTLNLSHMGKSPLILAALASEAVPGLRFKHVQPIHADSPTSDSALLTAESGEHFIIRLSKAGAAGADQDTELAALKLLASVDLPFDVAKLIGESRTPEGGRALLFSFIYGGQIDLETLNPHSPVTESLGASIAAIHNIPVHILQDAGFPEYDPSAIVQSRIAELDRALDTGKVPASLLQRWEHAFEDVALFRFQPTVIHGSIDSDNVVVNDQRVSGFMSWSNLKIADPAEDLAWVAGSYNSEAAYNVMLAYQAARPSADERLRLRAQLYSEFAMARWLLHGVKLGDDYIVEDAASMLQGLVEEIEAGERGPLTAVPAASQQVFEAKDLPESIQIVAEFDDEESDVAMFTPPIAADDTPTEALPIAADGTPTEALPIYEATIDEVSDDSNFYAETVEIVVAKDDDERLF